MDNHFYDYLFLIYILLYIKYGINITYENDVFVSLNINSLTYISFLYMKFTFLLLIFIFMQIFNIICNIIFNIHAKYIFIQCNL